MTPGAITNLESSRDCIHSSLAGDTLQVSSQDWLCSTCDAKIIASVSPKAGACLTEAPKQVVISLRRFADRLNAYIYTKDLVDSISVGVSVHDLTGSRSENLDQLEQSFLSHWTHLGLDVVLNESQANRFATGFDDEDDSLDLTSYDTRHRDRGDALEIEICEYTTLRIFFDGSGEIEHTKYERERRFATDKRDSGDDSEYSESYSTVRNAVDLPSFSNLENELDSLICGTDQVYEIAMAMVGVECKNEFCATHEFGEDRWKEFTDFMLYESEYLAQEQLNTRMSKNFPIGDLPDVIS